jgi:uncharacterized protein YodC (DUF2158 family)
MQTNTTHEYTDEQLLNALESSAPATAKLWEARSNDEINAIRIAIARAFLAALPKAAEPDPWTLPAPPPGRRWHREDWKPEWLEGGYRPLLGGEKIEIGDEVWLNKEYQWHVSKVGSDMPRTEAHPRSRTRRPLPAEASAEPEQAKPADDGPLWIPHDGGPCPLKDEEVEEWEVRYFYGTCGRFAMPISKGSGWVSLNDDGYTHYRVLKWKPGHGPQAASHADEPAQAEAVCERCGGTGWEYEDEDAGHLRCSAGCQVPAQTEAKDLAEKQDKIRMTVNEGLNKRCHELQELLRNAEAKIEELQRGQPPQPWTPRPGDVVRLKSGGPEMTVRGSEETDCSYVVWFVGNVPHTECFPNECLTPAKEGQP